VLLLENGNGESSVAPIEEEGYEIIDKNTTSYEKAKVE
jgi:hypothetical protein